MGSDDYQVNGTSLGLTFDSQAVFSLAFTQTTLTSGTWTILFDGNSFSGNSNTYTGLATGFNLYNSGTDDGSNTNNLYFNNLAITSIPEPSSLALLGGPVLLGAYLFVRRRR
ncbi:MAG TPA: PEP-CTERM sorting domain-containing protein [Chthoniobacterales bacterium]